MTDDPRNILLAYASRVSEAVVDLLGRDSIECVFASGGAARDEVASFRGPSGIEIYSDIDLFFIVRDGTDLDRARSDARRAAAKVPRRGDGFAVFPEPDVGVFTRSDFLEQKTRPGTVEIAESHVVLHGSADAPALARKFAASAIEPEEALYLVENRLVEIGRLSGPPAAALEAVRRRYARYAALKSCLDAGSSVLIVLGRFHPLRDERMRRLRDARSTPEGRGLLPENAWNSLESAYGALRNLQDTLGGESPAAGEALLEAAGLLLDNWIRIANHISGMNSNDWNALFEWRCKAGRWAANARELSVLARRLGVPRLRVMARGARLARLSPVDVLRLSGAARALAEARSRGGAPRSPLAEGSSSGYLGVLDALTRAFGYGGADLFERAGRMFGDTR
jgi:hypothetical protein